MLHAAFAGAWAASDGAHHVARVLGGVVTVDTMGGGGCVGAPLLQGQVRTVCRVRLRLLMCLVGVVCILYIGPGI